MKWKLGLGRELIIPPWVLRSHTCLNIGEIGLESWLEGNDGLLLRNLSKVTMRHMENLLSIIYTYHVM